MPYWPSRWPMVFCLSAAIFCAAMSVWMYLESSYWLMGVQIICALVNCGSFWRLRRLRQQLRASYKKAGIYVPN